jgi:hypothetical protein
MSRMDANQIRQATEDYVSSSGAIRAARSTASVAQLSRLGRLDPELLASLGCTYRCGSGVALSTTPKTHMSQVVQQCLSVLLLELVNDVDTASVDQVSVLAAMSAYNCWKEVVATESGAYAVAIVLMFYVETYSETQILKKTVRRNMQKILADWLGLDTSGDKLPSLAAVASALFGNGWCSFVLSDAAMSGNSESWREGYLSCNIAARERPPFRPGLCSAQVLDTGEVLPDSVGISS